MLDYTKFQNCLRIQITVDDLASKRIDDLVVHCKKYGFNNVMLLLNAEEFNLGHISIEEAKPWVDILEKAKEKLVTAGITVSINNWIEIGHLDRARILLPDQNFTTMVDFNGKESHFVACPLDEEWKKYFFHYVEFLIEEIQPDTFWIEDDFRYHNHGDLEWGGCFCKKHINQLNHILGKNYDREELVKRIFQKGEPSIERKAWLDLSKDSLITLADEIANVIRQIKPDTDIGLMSSTPEMHAMEGRDWKKLLEVLGGNNNKIDRIHLPGYFECAGKDYFFEFNSISMAVRALNPDDTIIMPETENGSANIYRKSPKFLQYQLESAIPLCIKGMTYSIYDFVGNGVVEDLGYSKKIKEITPYLQGVLDLNMKFSQLTGVIIPIGEEIAYKLPIINGYRDLLSNEFKVGGYFALLGITYAYSTKRKFNNQVIALFGQATYLFSAEELTLLFQNNKIIIDGGAVINLLNRNLGSLISATDAKTVIAETDTNAYEECIDGRTIYGVEKFRASCRSNAGDYVNIEYNQNLHEYTCIYDYHQHVFGKGIVSTGKIMIIPFIINKKTYGQFSELRRTILAEFVSVNTQYFVVSSCCGISPYLYKHDNNFVLIVVNSNVDDFDKIELQIGGIIPKKIRFVNRKGELENIKFKYKAGQIIISKKLHGLSSITFLVG